MGDVARAVADFIRWTEAHPLPPKVPTRAVVKALRRRLDARAPEWRLRVFEDDPGTVAVQVELHLRSGRLVRGALVQRPSRVTGEAA